MKILQINNVYGVGSTGKITQDIHKKLILAEEHSIVCYGRGKKGKEKNVYKVSWELYSKINNLISRFTGIMYGGCLISTINLIKKIKKEKPDIVHVQCINGYFVNIYNLINWLKKEKIKTILTLHAEFMYTANCGYALDCDKWKTGCGNCPRRREATKSLFFDGTAKSWSKMKKAFDDFENIKVVSVSPWLMERANQSPILKNKEHIVIYNGLDTEIFNCSYQKDIKEKYCPNGEMFVFHATASFSDDENDIKGGHNLIKLAKMSKGENIKFVVAGKYSIKGEIPENVILLGNVIDQKELAKLYSAADVTLLLSKKETFSMIVAESLCCGTPVVGFRAGAPEQIAIEEYSSFIEQGNLKGLKEQMIIMAEKYKDKKSSISERAINEYSSSRMSEEYIKLYRSII